MVRLKQERSKELFEPFEREAGLMPFSFDVTVEFAEEHLVHRAKKSFNPTPPLGLARGREHKACLEIDCNLFYVLRGEIRTIVCIKNLRNAADMPVRMPLPPDTLPKGRGPFSTKKVDRSPDNSRRSRDCNRRLRSSAKVERSARLHESGECSTAHDPPARWSFRWILTDAISY